MPSEPLTWLSAERFAVGDTVFQVPPPEMIITPNSMDGADVFIAKAPALVGQYAALVEELRPQRIVELGVLAGGSTALMCELAAPRRLVAVDNQRMDERLRDFLERKNLSETVEVHDDVDQADRRRLAEIVDAAFGDEPLDLVVDDCSHLYEQTRASFNELFPRLRPGGQYVIEDWPWAHHPVDGDSDGLFPGEEPLTRLVFEIMLALPSAPGLITEVVADEHWIRIERGDAAVDPAHFDIATTIRPRGLRLLARRRPRWLRRAS